MDLDGRRGSQNTEGRRRRPARRKSGARAIGVAGLGLIAIVTTGYLLGVDVAPFVNGNAAGIATENNAEITAADEQAAAFVSVTLEDTEEIWKEIFARQVGEVYDPPTLVLFKGQTLPACDGASETTGPYYCPSEEKAFMDIDFIVTMKDSLGAGGDFAAAYVVAHEVAHHVQNELDILSQVNRIRAAADEETSNALTMRVELQADCFSGIWARSAQEKYGLLGRGDIADAMNAVAQIAEDARARIAGPTVQPETFTHGTNEQRNRWFQRGYDSGDLSMCDTFSAVQL